MSPETLQPAASKMTFVISSASEFSEIQFPKQLRHSWLGEQQTFKKLHLSIPDEHPATLDEQSVSGAKKL